MTRDSAQATEAQSASSDRVNTHRPDENGDRTGNADKVPTVDGARVEIAQINVGEQPDDVASGSGFLRRFRRGLSLFLAGMYTGVKCGGVPRSHHTYGDDRDKRPL